MTDAGEQGVLGAAWGVTCQPLVRNCWGREWRCSSDAGQLRGKTTAWEPERRWCTNMTFIKTTSLLLDACPGPSLARGGLRIAALQPIIGIPELEPSENGGQGQEQHVANPQWPWTDAMPQGYLSSIKQIADRLNCRPAYLSKSALRHGYSFSRALRWIRFLHAVTLLTAGCRTDTMVWRLGFSDIAGWSRFTNRLVGRSPRQIPLLPLDHWVRIAIDDIYFGLPTNGRLRRQARRG